MGKTGPQVRWTRRCYSIRRIKFAVVVATKHFPSPASWCQLFSVARFALPVQSECYSWARFAGWLSSVHLDDTQRPSYRLRACSTDDGRGAGGASLHPQLHPPAVVWNLVRYAPAQYLRLRERHERVRKPRFSTAARSGPYPPLDPAGPEGGGPPRRPSLNTIGTVHTPVVVRSDS